MIRVIGTAHDSIAHRARNGYAARMQAFSDWLTARRADLSLSQADLARESTIDSSLIGRWETGSTKPSPANLARVAPALSVPYEDLMKMCGYLPGTPAPHPVRSALQARLDRVGETLSRYPVPFQQAVMNAIEEIARAGETIQAPTNSPEQAETNRSKPPLSRGQPRRKGRLTWGYRLVSALYACRRTMGTFLFGWVKDPIVQLSRSSP